MSDIMLHGVLNMPHELWNDGIIDKIQRHSRYVEASKRIEKLESKLDKIKDWCEAYPVSVFPEPDLEKAARVLKENDMRLDDISASNMRHVLDGVKNIIEGEQ